MDNNQIMQSYINRVLSEWPEILRPYWKEFEYLMMFDDNIELTMGAIKYNLQRITNNNPYIQDTVLCTSIGGRFREIIKERYGIDENDIEKLIMKGFLDREIHFSVNIDIECNMNVFDCLHAIEQDIMEQDVVKKSLIDSTRKFIGRYTVYAFEHHNETLKDSRLKLRKAYLYNKKFKDEDLSIYFSLFGKDENEDLYNVISVLAEEHDDEAFDDFIREML